MDECPWEQCDKPWSEHVGLERVVHREKVEDRSCRCPVFFPDRCPVHGG